MSEARRRGGAGARGRRACQRPAPRRAAPTTAEPEAQRASCATVVASTCRIPRDVRRIATISDGLVEAVLLAVKAPVEIVAVGSTCLTRNFTYTFETRTGERYAYQGGQTPAAVLWPALRQAPVVAMSGTEINLEQLARTAPGRPADPRRVLHDELARRRSGPDGADAGPPRGVGHSDARARRARTSRASRPTRPSSRPFAPSARSSIVRRPPKR